MGNSMGGSKRRTAKVMKIDGTTFRLKPPVQAGDVVRDHPGYNVLESEEVKQSGLRAQPLAPNQLLKPGKLYFLVELPKLPDHRAPRRAWSGALQVSAKDRLESLKLSRRSVSDLSLAKNTSLEEAEGGVRLRMRLPKAEVAKLVEQSKDAADAAEKIMELCIKKDDAGVVPPATYNRRKEAAQKRTRFLPLPDEIIA